MLDALFGDVCGQIDSFLTLMTTPPFCTFCLGTYMLQSTGVGGVYFVVIPSSSHCPISREEDRGSTHNGAQIWQICFWGGRTVFV